MSGMQIPLLQGFRLSYFYCHWPYLHGSVTVWQKIELFCPMNLTLIMINKITIFVIMGSLQICMSFRQSSQDLDIIS